MIRGIIFDYGSTLMWLDADAKQLNAQGNSVLLEFLRDNGIPAGEDFLPLFRAAREDGWRIADQTLVEHTVEEALNTALGQIGYTPRNGLSASAVERFFQVGAQFERAYPETLETLQVLHSRGLRIGIISNADDDALVKRGANQLGFTHYVDPVLTSARGQKWRKPDPRIFLVVAQEWGLPPEQIAMVGDAPKYDILGAHRAGMRGILIDRDEGHSWQRIPEELANDPAIEADAVVHSLVEVPSVISKW